MGAYQDNNQSMMGALSLLQTFLTGRPGLRLSDALRVTGSGTSISPGLRAPGGLGRPDCPDRPDGPGDPGGPGRPGRPSGRRTGAPVPLPPHRTRP